jgi:hypothetical protein
MLAAQLSKGQIDNADRLRREFRMRQTEPKYQQDNDFSEAELEVVARLQLLPLGQFARFPERHR